jgi:hypothetical protein
MGKLMLKTLGPIAGLVIWAALAMPAEAEAPNYQSPDSWLCRPGRDDACAANLDATAVAADGTLTREAFQADPNAPVDCFYVYPTVSHQAGGNADMTIDPDEKNVVVQQFARFGAKCRLFAPMYRQVTVTALRAYMTGHPIAADRQMAYEDVLAAWNDYLTHDNKGRGVVLVGHSQGSNVLTQLIKNEIDGKPIQAKLISAILMGTSLSVPKGADIGGAFQHIPLCHAASQIGCVVAFASFRAATPPPEDSHFGRVREDGMAAACVNPAALGGGAGALDAYLSEKRIAGDPGLQEASWTTPPKPIDTLFVKVPGMLTAECVNNEHGSYLAVTVHPTPGGARINDIGGDVIVGGKVQENWGLHLIDANLTMGNLVALVGDQAKAYLAKAGE